VPHGTGPASPTIAVDGGQLFMLSWHGCRVPTLGHPLSDAISFSEIMSSSELELTRKPGVSMDPFFTKSRAPLSLAFVTAVLVLVDFRIGWMTHMVYCARPV
jgi:hypothetical protein